MKTIRTSSSRRNGNYVIQSSTSIGLIIVGAIISAPFIIDTIILGNAYHQISFWLFLQIVGLLIGGPMLLGGMISLFTRKSASGSSSTAELDIARIRYNIENDFKKR